VTDGEQAEAPGEAVDPGAAITGAKVASAAFEESRGLLKRVLGPAADELGQFLAEWTKIRLSNALRVAEKADERLTARGTRVEDAGISGRAALRIFDEAAYCGDENEIVVEYLGGLLASSRVVGQSNDLGNSYAALISRMAADHLRMHYVCYLSILKTMSGKGVNFYAYTETSKAHVFIPLSTLRSAFPDEVAQDRIYSAIFWLSRESLISGFGGGGGSILQKIGRGSSRRHQAS
jgi:hypothetical protein